MQPARAMAASDWALLAVLSVLWGGSFFFNKVAVNELPPLTVALGRVGFGALFLLMIVRALGQTLPATASVWAALAVMGLFNSALPFSLIIWSQQHVSSGLASILIAMTPLFTVLVAHWATDDDRLTPSRAVGLMFGLVGVIVMIGPDLLGELGAQVAAQFALLAAALAYACSGVYARRFSGLPVAVIAAVQMTTASMILAPLVLVIERPWTLPTPSWQAIAAIVGLGTLCTALGYLIYFRVLARVGATNLLLVNFMIPVSAILLGVTILGERIEWRQVAGMALIALGLAAIDGRLARKFQRGALQRVSS